MRLAGQFVALSALGENLFRHCDRRCGIACPRQCHLANGPFVCRPIQSAVPEYFVEESRLLLESFALAL